MKVFDKGASYTKGSKKSAVMQDGPYKGGKAKVPAACTLSTRYHSDMLCTHGSAVLPCRLCQTTACKDAPAVCRRT